MFNNNREYMNAGSMARGFMQQVFGWMFAGLTISASVAYYLSPAVNPALFMRLVNGPLTMLLFAQFGIVMFFSFSWKSLSYGANVMLFLAYSTLSGITLSPLAYVYTGESLGLTFGVAASLFAVMALYGYITDADLSGIGSMMSMALFGLIIAMFANWFMQSSQLSFFISGAAVIIFTALTAWDLQKLKYISHYAPEDPSMRGKLAIVGALNLYLNLLNIFIHLLHLMGKKK